jgi:hypothetical protein
VTPSLVVCLRHGEKPADSEEKSDHVNDDGPGLDVHGRVNKHSLTIRGWQRAGALSGTQLGGQVPSSSIGSASLFVPDYGPDTKDHRPYQTISPLARRWGIKPELPGPADCVPSLRDRVLAASGPAVVCWEHDNLATFVGQLLGYEIKWPSGRFDVFWLLHPGGTGADAWSCQQVDQALLPGDAGAGGH